MQCGAVPNSDPQPDYYPRLLREVIIWKGVKIQHITGITHPHVIPQTFVKHKKKGCWQNDVPMKVNGDCDSARHLLFCSSEETHTGFGTL